MAEERKKHLLNTQGNLMKGKGHQKGKDYMADDATRKNPTMSDVGIGSSFTLARLRNEAQRVKAERRIPGNLGYQVNLGPKSEVAGSTITKQKRMLYNGKK